jgi:hypothetical protein
MSELPKDQPSPPVLVLLFNRPEVTRRLLEAMNTTRPKELYVAADGPRASHPEDRELCARTRELVESLSWPCRVHRLYRDTNLGLQAAVTSALDWFFDQVEAGIVLEDDCIPAPAFFPFAAEMLERYSDDSRVMHVSGLNMKPNEQFSPDSYFFTRVGHIWGWATWRRAWRLNDPTMSKWPALRRQLGPGTPKLQRVLGRKFASAYAGRKKTWSRVWYYSISLHSGMAIIPATNMVSNIGFGEDATHTRGGRHPLRLDASGNLPTSLLHPREIVPNTRYERYLTRYHKGSYRRQASDLGHAFLDKVMRRHV